MTFVESDIWMKLLASTTIGKDMIDMISLSLSHTHTHTHTLSLSVYIYMCVCDLNIKYPDPVFRLLSQIQDKEPSIYKYIPSRFYIH